jgi:hypothetical protein
MHPAHTPAADPEAEPFRLGDCQLAAATLLSAARDFLTPAERACLTGIRDRLSDQARTLAARLARSTPAPADEP